MQRYLQFVDRYFTPLYQLNVKGKALEDHLILQHSNRICIVAVAPSHAMFQCRRKITNVDFQVTSKLNRLDNKVSGKRKRGAQMVNETSPLCHITCDDGSKYTISSCVKGKLIEINELLIENPDLLAEKPCTEGFIAVILPRKVNRDKNGDDPILGDGFLSKESYCKAIADRVSD
ncbi:expressed hypothetical protein [Trichoplax adhaerens]|uniref:Protein Abitram n=1 Tax=Trichoplax adhaerens TaxID=10228 RepID=B3SC65_TRIAD|nr:expressed hypothetical protein [Trichoplax adhaerens]EDV19667.1 expressed hypothetical protein [Trichoplax adhaerens]|eukprot:XP_002117824.1 expressed hypothetical protein [Trichoplax adhaerens]